MDCAHIRRLRQNRLQALSLCSISIAMCDAKDRAHLAIANIEERLITLRGRFYKPKGMLWRTFHRLCDRYDHHDAVLNAGLFACLSRG
jgi:hypothetical protein